MAGHNNWISVGKGYAELDFSALVPMSKRNAIDHTLEQITKLDGKLFLALSGGMDSEFIANCLYERGVSFTPLLVDYGLNAAELWYARLWCKEHRMTPKILQLSLNDMLQSLPAIALQYQTAYISSIDFVMEMYAAMHDAKLLIGPTEPFSTISVSKDFLDVPLSPMLEWYDFDFAVDIAFPGKHPLCFLSYTPEMTYSLVREFDYTLPPQLAKAAYYGIAPRPKMDVESKLAMNAAVRALSARTHKHLELYKIELGHKARFLQMCEEKRILVPRVTKL